MVATLNQHLLVNGDFEADSLASGAPGVNTDVPEGNYSFGAPTGWTVTGGSAGLWRPTAMEVDDNTNVTWLRGGAVLSQDTTVQLATGMSYTLQLDAGHRSDEAFPGATATLVAVLADGSTVALNSTTLTDPGTGHFGTMTVSTGPLAASLAGATLRVVVAQTDGSANQVLVDNVALSTNLVANGGFEADSLATGTPGVMTDVPEGNYTFGAPSGWTVTGTPGSAGLWHPTAMEVTDNTNVVWLRSGAVLAQNTNIELTGGVNYSLQLDAGHRSDEAFPGAVARLVAVAADGSTVVLGSTTLTDPGVGAVGNTTLNSGPIAQNLAGATLRVEIAQTDGSANQVLVDNVTVTQSVLTNGGFEADSLATGTPGVTTDVPEGNYSFGVPTGWTVTGAAGTAGLWHPSGLEVNDTTNVVWLRGGAALTQDTGLHLTAGQTYTLQLDAGHRSDEAFPGATATLVAVEADGTRVVLSSTTLSDPGAGQFGTFTVSSGPVPANLVGATLSVQIAQADGSGNQVLVDNVQVTTTVDATKPVELFNAHGGLIGSFARIQDAVNAAGNGQSIHVAAGTYTEQVTVDGKTGLSIVGAGEGQTIIRSPDAANLAVNATDSSSSSPDKYALVAAIHGADVTISGLTVDGHGQGTVPNAPNPYDFVGLYGLNAGVHADHVDVTGIESVVNGLPSGAQQNSAVIVTDTDGVARTFDFANSSVENFQKNGLRLSGAGLTVNVHDDSVTGAGAIPSTAQNGIEVLNGATGTIDHVTLSGIDYTGTTGVSAADVLVIGANGVHVTNSTLTGSTGDGDTGIYVANGTGAVVTGNTLSDFGSGIAFVSADGATATGNSIANTGTGISEDGTFTTVVDPTGNTFTSLPAGGNDFYFHADGTDPGNFTINGTSGADLVFGGSGTTTIIGHGGADQLVGGSGATTFVFANAAELNAASFVGGSSGHDTIEVRADATLTDASFAAVGAIDTLQLDGTGAQSVTLGTNAGAITEPMLTITAAHATSLAVDASGLAANLALTVDGHATTGSDVLTGGAGTTTLIGGSGDDPLTGGAGTTTLEGGAGNDALVGGSGATTAFYVGSVGDYVITPTATGFTVQATNAANGDLGTDTLTGISAIHFNGSNTTLDLTQPVELLDGAGHLVSTFTHIQDAVNAASSGETIKLAAGTYAEQVTDNGVSNLTIEGAGAATIITAPTAGLVVNGHSDHFATDVRADVAVLNATGVTIKDLTVDGDYAGDRSTGSNGDEISGIAFLNGGGTVDGVTVERTGNSPTPQLFGLQHGSDILSDDGTGPQQALTVTGSILTDFQKTGLLAWNTTLDVNHDTITGIGATALTGQNGIQAGGSSGSLASNNISGLGYAAQPGDATAASDIIVYSPTAPLSITGTTFTGVIGGQTEGIDLSDVANGHTVTITGDSFTNTDYGLYAYTYDATQGLNEAPVLSGNTFSGVRIENIHINPEEVDGPGGGTFSTTTALTLTGSSGTDFLHGSAGVNTFLGGGGADTLIGGSGANNFDFASVADFTAAGRTIQGGTGFNTVLLQADASVTDAAFTGVTGIDALAFGGTGAQSATLGGGAAAAFNNHLSITAINASVLSVNGARLGTSTELDVVGTAHGADRIVGGAGSNHLTGGDASTLVGGSGFNLLTSGGHDTLIGGSGLNEFVFDDGVQFSLTGRTVIGGSGPNILVIAHDATLTDAGFSGISGADALLLGGSGAQSVTLGSNAAAAFGTGVVTVAAQNAASLTVDGSALTAGSSIQSVGTTAGADRFTGGQGDDMFTAGGGQDTFVFLANNGADTVTGFSHANGDVLALQGTALHSFAAVQAAATQVGSDTVIAVDAHDSITLTGITKASLMSSDFMFS